MAADDASDAEALFCLELYVHRVERLPKRLRGAARARAAVLDYAPVVVEPPSGARGNHRGSCWYGGGKRCVFEAREELAKKLEQRRDARCSATPSRRAGPCAGGSTGRRRSPCRTSGRTRRTRRRSAPCGRGAAPRPRVAGERAR